MNQHFWLQLFLVAVAAILVVILAERFSPDETLTKIVKLAVFAALVFYLITKIMPLIA